MTTALDELLSEALEWFPEGSVRTHDTSRIVHRLCAVVKRQREGLKHIRWDTDDIAIEAFVDETEADCETLAKGEK